MQRGTALRVLVDFVYFMLRSKGQMRNKLIEDFKVIYTTSM